MNRLELLVRHGWPILAIALASTIAGGLVAGITAHAPTQPATWAAGYLVLVGGVATFGLTLGRGLLSAGKLTQQRIGIEFAAWMAGNALVLAGGLVEVPWLVDIGSLLLAVALALVVFGVQHGGDSGPGEAVGPKWMRWLFLALVIVLLISIPIGAVISHLRS